MTVGNNKVIGITYQLHVGDPEDELVMVEKIEENEIFYFIYGNSGLPKGFETRLSELREGDAFKFSLTADEGFGRYDDAALIYVPKQSFEIDGKVEDKVLEKGNFIPMTDDRGYQVQGKVVEVELDKVLMDFNHPLVGMQLHFEGCIESTREATAQEIANGHVHGTQGNELND